MLRDSEASLNQAIYMVYHGVIYKGLAADLLIMLTLHPQQKQVLKGPRGQGPSVLNPLRSSDL